MRTNRTNYQRLFLGPLALTLSLAVSPTSRAQDKTIADKSQDAPYYDTYYGYTGLHAAAAQNNVEHLKELLDADPILLSSRNGANRTPLCIAAMRGEKEALEYLISRGADINDRGFGELTPLADLAMYGTTNDARAAEIAEILIAHGATVDPLDTLKVTPLLHAVEWNKLKLARVLLTHGADPAKTFSGTYARLTPLQYALQHSQREMAAMILEFKPPLEWIDSDGSTPLMWAVKAGKLDAARLLLEHGASPTPVITRESAQMTPALYHFVTNNSHGCTPLHWAMLRNNHEMIALLVQYKAPADARDEGGFTPLHLAVARGDAETTELFLQAGTPVDVAEKRGGPVAPGAPDGNTPLHIAAAHTNQAVVAVLLKYHASLESRNSAGQTPIDIAKQRDNAAIEALLRAAAPARIAGQPAPLIETTGNIVPRQSMIDLAQRIADGDPGALGELTSLSEELFRGVDYRSNPAQAALNADRLNAAVKVLGDEAAKGNDHAFQALKTLVKDRHFSYSVATALGAAATAGRPEAIEILSHPNDWNILYTTADLQLEPAASANVSPAVDYFVDVLLNPTNAAHGRYGVAQRSLESAAGKGNQKAKDALEKFASFTGPHF